MILLPLQLLNASAIRVAGGAVAYSLVSDLVPAIVWRQCMYSLQGASWKGSVEANSSRYLIENCYSWALGMGTGDYQAVFFFKKYLHA